MSYQLLMNNGNVLVHYGVKGMKWGIRHDRRYNDLAKAGSRFLNSSEKKRVQAKYNATSHFRTAKKFQSKNQDYYNKHYSINPITGKKHQVYNDKYTEKSRHHFIEYQLATKRQKAMKQEINDAIKRLESHGYTVESKKTKILVNRGKTLVDGTLAAIGTGTLSLAHLAFPGMGLAVGVANKATGYDFASGKKYKVYRKGGI